MKKTMSVLLVLAMFASQVSADEESSDEETSLLEGTFGVPLEGDVLERVSVNDDVFQTNVPVKLCLNEERSLDQDLAAECDVEETFCGSQAFNIVLALYKQVTVSVGPDATDPSLPCAGSGTGGEVEVRTDRVTKTCRYWAYTDSRVMYHTDPATNIGGCHWSPEDNTDEACDGEQHCPCPLYIEQCIEDVEKMIGTGSEIEPWVTVGPDWADAACTGTLSKEVEHTEVEAALIDTPIIDFVKVSYSHTEIKIGYEFACNVAVTPSAWGGGGVLRSVYLLVDGNVVNSCPYNGATEFDCRAKNGPHTAPSPAGSGTVGEGGDYPTGVDVCFQLDLEGWNKQNVIGSSITDTATGQDLCTTLGITYHWDNTGEVVELVEGVLTQ